MPKLLSYNVYKISFTGADSFFMSYTKYSVNKAINEILYRIDKRPRKYIKLYDFIEKVGIESITIEHIGCYSRLESIQLIKKMKPNLN